MSNAREFGAAGDGRTDDTEALQHAVDDGEGLIDLDPGVYRISKTIEVALDRRGPFGLRGSAGTAVIQMTGPGPAFRLVGTHQKTGDPQGVLPGVWDRERMPTVAGIVVEGTHPEADGFELVRTMQATFDGVFVRKCRHAIRLFERNRNVLISGCHLYNNTGIGIFLDQLDLHQINIVGNHISYNRLGGIRIEGSSIRNLQITGNDIEYNNHRAFDAEALPTAEIYIDTTAAGSSVEEVTVASNTIQATPSAGGANIRMLQTPDGRPPRLWTITGNIIGNQECNMHLTHCRAVMITGNVIYSAQTQNLLLENCSEINVTGNGFRRHTGDLGAGVRVVDSQDCVFSGCTLRDESPLGQPSGLSLVEIQRCRRITVNGCQIIDGVPFGIDVSESSQINITGCTIADTRSERIATADLRFTGEGKSNLVTGNILSKPPSAEAISGVTQANNVDHS